MHRILVGKPTGKRRWGVIGKIDFKIKHGWKERRTAAVVDIRIGLQCCVGCANINYLTPKLNPSAQR
jgi:hypothetical protein